MEHPTAGLPACPTLRGGVTFWNAPQSGRILQNKTQHPSRRDSGHEFRWTGSVNQMFCMNGYGTLEENTTQGRHTQILPGSAYTTRLDKPRRRRLAGDRKSVSPPRTRSIAQKLVSSPSTAHPWHLQTLTHPFRPSSYDSKCPSHLTWLSWVSRLDQNASRFVSMPSRVGG